MRGSHRPAVPCRRGLAVSSRPSISASIVCPRGLAVGFVPEISLLHTVQGIEQHRDIVLDSIPNNRQPDVEVFVCGPIAKPCDFLPRYLWLRGLRFRTQLPSRFSQYLNTKLKTRHCSILLCTGLLVPQSSFASTLVVNADRSGPQNLHSVLRCSRLAKGAYRHDETEAVFIELQGAGSAGGDPRRRLVRDPLGIFSLRHNEMLEIYGRLEQSSRYRPQLGIASKVEKTIGANSEST